MHIKMLWAANILDKQLREKREHRELIASGKGLGVTIQSKYQPDDLLEAVRPAVLAHLDAQIANCEAELQKLGIDLAPA
jgi:hypothetical protein